MHLMTKISQPQSPGRYCKKLIKNFKPINSLVNIYTSITFAICQLQQIFAPLRFFDTSGEGNGVEGEERDKGKMASILYVFEAA